ncbi:inosine-uridine preferring nucleoside hydrolase-like [Histomonas meleagridis]|uniref:inosine-uridine preferring nucleoside hydrolase-like n=1 Tax=Histomonas meleagridis TaxID=135588 RepID=UPI00355AA9EB|nr:inosine-uridine preferring nucleoside hydrolase-like [Histomonas meleagridis]KAH0796805.1 inosine-uridine preferring nucleoside hydrolase-like [Histomonas meleagridis]
MKKVWIDTDCGVDDSLAIILALNCPNVEVLGISCIGGNTSVDNVTNNVLRTLAVYGKQDIPVYRGCEQGLIADPIHIPEIHGNDGLGDVDFASYGIKLTAKVQPTNAIFAIIDTFLHNDDITLITIGPLTNIAIAIHVEPKIIDNIKNVFIMGGAEDMKGNTTKYAEFNFKCDPEAAHMVLKSIPNFKITLITWTLSCKNIIKGNLLHEFFGQGCTIMERWIRDIWQVAIKHDSHSAIIADPLTAFVACYGEKAIVDTVKMKFEIPLFGEKIAATVGKEDPCGVTVVKAIDFEFLKEVFRRILKDH